MKIILITNGFQFDYETNYANGLFNHAEEVILIGGDHYPVERLNPGIRFINLRGSHEERSPWHKKVTRVIKYYLSLLVFVLKSDVTLVHFIWMRFPLLEGFFLTSAFRLLGKKCIYTVHDVVPHDRDTRNNRIRYRIVYRTQDKLLAHTEYIKQRLIKEFGIHEDKIHVFRHGIYDIQYPADIPEGEARKEFSVGDKDFMILFYGAIAQYKGLDLLFRTFESLEKEKSLPWKLIVAGRVHPAYRTAFDELERSITSPNISIFKGYVDDISTRKLFLAANVTILPYYEASQSGVLFLSYAYGVPVIAPSFGGFPYDVVEGRTGYLFAKGDQVSLADALLKVNEHCRSAGAFRREEIREYAMANYSWDIECGKLLRSLSEINPA